MRCQCLTKRCQCLTKRCQCLTMRCQCLTKRCQCLTKRCHFANQRLQCETNICQCTTIICHCANQTLQCTTNICHCTTNICHCTAKRCHCTAKRSDFSPAIRNSLQLSSKNFRQRLYFIVLTNNIQTTRMHREDFKNFYMKSPFIFIQTTYRANLPSNMEIATIHHRQRKKPDATAIISPIPGRKEKNANQSPYF